MSEARFEVVPVGWVESPLTDRASAPLQGHEGSPEAWLDRARRDVLRVHPRGDVANPEQGVFNTRSPDRPNPIGLHRVEIVSVDGDRFRVRNLEALDGTPIVDVKPLLTPGELQTVS
jgi:tRNA (Thr-GGU) A37 N-methylase